MCALAKKEKRFDTKWGVVNPGNALCVQIFETRKGAEAWRKQHARAYRTVRVCITPLYQQEMV